MTLRPVVLLILVACDGGARAQSLLSAALRSKVDQAAQAVLAETGAPSASIAIVTDGRIAFLQAHGNARLEPRVAATPEMRYSIGSISKQFTAAAILMLAERGKLSLDDPVSRFLPSLTRAKEVTIRQLLSHTSGFQDYWPQDYVPPLMLQPIAARTILELWARKPLDFDPGTKWQYSNTNYVIAGLIAEKASGMPLFQFLREKIFTPLGMLNVTDSDQEKLGEADPTGYMRYALGPLRAAPKEGKGWLFAAGELAMPAADLAKWDISLMEEKLMKPASYGQLETEVRLKNGLGARYGLGIGVFPDGGRRALEHDGEVSGFTAQNNVFPDERAAIVVLTNQDASRASGEIANRIASLLFFSADQATAAKLETARKIFDGLQHGMIDRKLFTANANSYFSDDALQDFASSLGPLGSPQEFTQTSRSLRGGMTGRVYSVKFASKSLRIWTFEMPDGEFEQYQIAPQ
ncbi:MAG TPA: serine hydrolase domain-containing protein [Bryobacteraceae bacterium]|nr:serine hydrolase domain-containing protein [Bryobacteraceae bacterium]